GPSFTTCVGRFPQQVDLLLGEGWLILRTGSRHQHLVRWDRAELEVCSVQTDPATPTGVRAFLVRHRDLWPLRLTGIEAEAKDLPAWARYDRRRFRKGAGREVSVALDCFGQVAVSDRGGRLVCMFFAFHGQLAAWMPDGTRLGPPGLGGPPTPDAA